MRFNHYLKRNEHSESPSNVLIIDTEANISRKKDGSQIQTFRLGCANHLMLKNGEWYETEYRFHSIDDFWKLLDRIAYEKKRLYVFAHNMAYDYAILKLDTYLSSRNMEIKMRVIDSVFMIRADNILFLSSTNYYRQSLAELGKIFGLLKSESPNFEDCSDAELMPYCMQDVKVLSHIIKAHIAFIKDNDLGCFKPTIAGQAMTAYRHRFMHHDLLVHAYNDILELEKMSYRGGRCEAFRIGKFENIYALDINSMYPFVMKTEKYPTKLITSKPILEASVSELERIVNSERFALADCLINLKKPVIACKKEKLLFPIGDVRQVITSPEIKYLFEHPEYGTILKADKIVVYEQENIFSEYVDFFYGFRQNTTNEAYKQMSKVMLNSLYGKFGQHCSTIPTLITDDIKIKMYTEIMNMTGSLEILTALDSKIVKLGESLYQVSKMDGEFSRDSIPIIASAVTSYSRILLYDLMEKANLSNVLYCDTDSLFVNEYGYHNLQDCISQTDLGKLKLEKSGTAEIRGAKDYTFNGKVKLKGVKANAELLPDGTFKQLNWQTKNSRYRNGTPDGQVLLKPIIKRISHNYDKGIVKDGIVSPHVFADS